MGVNNKASPVREIPNGASDDCGLFCLVTSSLMVGNHVSASKANTKNGGPPSSPTGQNSPVSLSV